MTFCSRSFSCYDTHMRLTQLALGPGLASYMCAEGGVLSLFNRPRCGQTSSLPDIRLSRNSCLSTPRRCLSKSITTTRPTSYPRFIVSYLKRIASRELSFVHKTMTCLISWPDHSQTVGMTSFRSLITRHNPPRGRRQTLCILMSYCLCFRNL